jgi:signal peptidase II
MERRKVITDGKLSLLLIFLILLIDQIIKIGVKTNMCLHESVEVTPWFFINFIENNGMAYGMTFINKLVLSLFRIVAITVIAYYIWLQVKQKVRTGYIVCLSMILAGAAGNIFDSMFYGLIFDASSPYHVSTLVPFGEGYAPFLRGKVVDMFYFPLFSFTWPEWVPLKGGEEYTFFSAIFNFADASISVGIALLLLFYRRELGNLSLRPAKPDAEETMTEDKPEVDE